MLYSRASTDVPGIWIDVFGVLNCRTVRSGAGAHNECHFCKWYRRAPLPPVKLSFLLQWFQVAVLPLASFRKCSQIQEGAMTRTDCVKSTKNVFTQTHPANETETESKSWPWPYDISSQKRGQVTLGRSLDEIRSTVCIGHYMSRSPGA